MSNGEWGVFTENDGKLRIYFCNECRLFCGTMRYRRVSDSDGNIHKEYKIVCDRCGKSGTVHWSKNLAEHSWKASNPNFDNDYISKDAQEIMKWRKEVVEKRES